MKRLSLVIRPHLEQGRETSPWFAHGTDGRTHDRPCEHPLTPSSTLADLGSVLGALNNPTPQFREDPDVAKYPELAGMMTGRGVVCELRAHGGEHAAVLVTARGRSMFEAFMLAVEWRRAEVYGRPRKEVRHG